MFLSCNSNEYENRYRKIDRQLSAEVVELSDPVFRPGRVFSISDKLVVFDKVEKEVFKVFSTADGELMNAWGDLGDGPTASFDYIDLNSMQQDGEYIEFLGYPVYNKYKVEKNGDLTLDRSVDLSFSNTDINRFLRLNDDLAIINNPPLEKADVNEHLLLSMKNRQILKPIGIYPETNSTFNTPEDRSNFFLKNLISSKRKEIFYTFYFGINLFKRYNFNGDELGAYTFSTRSVSMDPREENSMHFFALTATEDYVYALYSGRTTAEIEAKLDQFKPHLIVLDWAGNIVRHYQLDRALVSIAVDAQNRRLYGIAPDESTPFLRYDLPNL